MPELAWVDDSTVRSDLFGGDGEGINVIGIFVDRDVVVQALSAGGFDGEVQEVHVDERFWNRRHKSVVASQHRPVGLRIAGTCEDLHRLIDHENPAAVLVPFRAEPIAARRLIGSKNDFHLLRRRVERLRWIPAALPAQGLPIVFNKVEHFHVILRAIVGRFEEESVVERQPDVIAGVGADLPNALGVRRVVHVGAEQRRLEVEVVLGQNSAATVRRRFHFDLKRGILAVLDEVVGVILDEHRVALRHQRFLRKLRSAELPERWT